MTNRYSVGDVAYYGLKDEKVEIKAMAGQDPRGQLYAVVGIESGKGYNAYGRDLDSIEE